MNLAWQSLTPKAVGQPYKGERAQGDSKKRRENSRIIFILGILGDGRSLLAFVTYVWLGTAPATTGVTWKIFLTRGDTNAWRVVCRSRHQNSFGA